MTSPLLSTPGATPAAEDSPDVGVAWHYGDPFGEQRAATTRAVVVDRSNRGVIAVPGGERRSWLHSLTSQHVLGLADGQGTEALILDVNGRVEHHLVLADLDGTTWIDTEPTSTQSLLAYLQKMVFWADVAPRDASDELAVLTVLGPTADQLLELPAEVHGVRALPGGGFVRRMPAPAGSHAADVVVPRAALATWWQRLTEAGARPAGSWAHEALRVEQGRPRAGVDTDERTIPHEAGWIHRAVHLDKGCYRGQETVARVHNLGKPPRRLVLLHLDGSADARPQTGDDVTAAGRVVGRVGTVAEHHELGPIALALVKRTVPADTELVAGPSAAAIDPDSVTEDTEVQAGRAALSRLRGR
ncbi:folate-binding protein YgfZ [Rhodococcus sp. X156]|uniref:CAF17-like 4Fe-4S cluster assembly/insertion protein YgfZ n=1 Tax=Rhodococcus sp. X156 TaxID=2499145 RepID=UPI000FD9EE79|nr:folate-binding protein YgfZ [Rhodococcus sp. X156]